MHFISLKALGGWNFVDTFVSMLKDVIIIRTLPQDVPTLLLLFQNLSQLISL